MFRTPFCGYGTNALQNICFYDRIFAEILSRNGKNCKILHKGAGIMKNLKKILVSVILSVGLLTGNAAGNLWMPETVYGAVDLASVPSYTGSAYTVLNDNVPEFTEEDLALESFESYSELDSLGRCGAAFANIGQELMPTEERGKIGQVRPSGWHTQKYDCVDGKYLYNRCHLIGYQLTGENANEENLITGTRYMNVEGMLPFEDMTADYIRETGNHVLYRVTPLYNGDDLVASGVQMEAQSIEDGGQGVLFNVYCYNVQPGVGIDYSTGDSWEETEDFSAQESPELSAGTEETFSSPEQETFTDKSAAEATYILNVNTGKFHRPDCHSVNQMKEKNKMEMTGTRDELVQQGYSPCQNCNP